MLTHRPLIQFTGSAHSLMSERTEGRRLKKKQTKTATETTAPALPRAASRPCREQRHHHITQGHLVGFRLLVPLRVMVGTGSHQQVTEHWSSSNSPVKVLYLCSCLHSCPVHNHHHRRSGTSRAGSGRSQRHRCSGRCIHQCLQNKESWGLRIWPSTRTGLSCCHLKAEPQPRVTHLRMVLVPWDIISCVYVPSPHLCFAHCPHLALIVS